MSKLIVLLMQNEYPFTQNPQYSYQSHNILVRQSLEPARGNKNTILAKANFVKNLKNKYLVKVDSLFQETQNIHIMYEYVETKFSNVIKGASLMLISKVHAQLREFGTYLSNIGVRILFNMDRIGLTGQDCLKYFMGLDFQWEDDPDQQFLEQFYQKQTEELLGGYLKQKTIKTSIIPQSTTGHSFFRNEDQNKQRKISFSTLPSRYNRFYKIDQKLKEIKSTSKSKDIQVATKKNLTLQIPTGRNMFQKNMPVKKFQDRKYSGQVKYQVESKAKLFEKESDIQSEYWQRKKKSTPKQEQSMNSQRESAKTKSRTEEMKEKQYREISSLKKDYLKDFISVLEEDEDNNLILPPSLDYNEIEQFTTKQKPKEMTLKRTDSALLMHENTAKDLQKLAKQAIEHSLKVMNKFKSIMNDS